MRQLKTFLVALTLATSAFAADIMIYSKDNFDKAVKNGKHVAIQFHADWCPTCKKQEASLKELRTEKSFADVMFFKADFDTEKALKKELKVTGQSTIVIFNKGKEVARSSGVTDTTELKKLIKSEMSM